MSKFTRVKNILTGLISILLGLMLFFIPEEAADAGFYVVVLILSLGLLISGIKEIIFYFSMAIHMVGGKRSLYRGVIILEVAFFTMSLYEIPRIFILLYLIGVHAFSGGVEIMRAMEAKKNDSSYILKLIQGIMDILLAACCLVFIKNGNIATYIYAAGLINSSIMKIIGSFKKTAVVYIQ